MIYSPASLGTARQVGCLRVEDTVPIACYPSCRVATFTNKFRQSCSEALEVVCIWILWHLAGQYSPSCYDCSGMAADQERLGLCWIVVQCGDYVIKGIPNSLMKLNDHLAL